MRRLSLFLIVLTVSCLSAFAQMFEPIKWKFSTKTINQSTTKLVFNATIDRGWHLYGMKLFVFFVPVCGNLVPCRGASKE